MSLDNNYLLWDNIPSYHIMECILEVVQRAVSMLVGLRWPIYWRL